MIRRGPKPGLAALRCFAPTSRQASIARHHALSDADAKPSVGNDTRRKKTKLGKRTIKEYRATFGIVPAFPDSGQAGPPHAACAGHAALTGDYNGRRLEPMGWYNK